MTMPSCARASRCRAVEHQKTAHKWPQRKRKRIIKTIMYSGKCYKVVSKSKPVVEFYRYRFNCSSSKTLLSSPVQSSSLTLTSPSYTETVESRNLNLQDNLTETHYKSEHLTRILFSFKVNWSHSFHSYPFWSPISLASNLATSFTLLTHHNVFS